MRRRLTRQFRRWLYVSHQWIGIATCLLFAIWFVSGLVMMYVAFPGLTDGDRLAALPVIAWHKVQLAPDRAMAIAGLTHFPRELRLSMLNDEPVYRLRDWSGERQSVSAVDGRLIARISRDTALSVAHRHPRAVDVRLLKVVERDQWSVTARFDPLRPLFLIALGDTAGTQLYVSSVNGEIVLDTTHTERVWNWLGSIPHWIYPTILRQDGALWRSVVLWISGICMIVAVSGIWIGILRVRLSGIWIGILRVRLKRRYSGGAITPYRGWMAWHHVTGFFAGVFVLTWIFSGWLSLDPGRVFADRALSREMLVRYAGHDTPDIAGTSAEQSLPVAAEARFAWLGGKPLMLLTDRDGATTSFDAVTGAAAPISEQQALAAARSLILEAAIIRTERLTRYDAYWYAHHEQRVLPVLRIGFDDAAHSWLHVDPRSGEILDRTDSSRRTYRWLFNALHSFDFPLLLAWRPAWDIVVWLLSILGTIVSVSGIVIGWRRMAR